jgi:hypothetical protein
VDTIRLVKSRDRPRRVGGVRLEVVEEHNCTSQVKYTTTCRPVSVLGSPSHVSAR